MPSATSHSALSWSPTCPTEQKWEGAAQGCDRQNIWELSLETHPPPVYDKPIRVNSSPSSLGSCPPLGSRRTEELSLGRSWSHNARVQSSLVLLLLPGLTEGTGSDLALGVQHQAVCTSPGRSSVPGKDNWVCETDTKTGKQQVGWRAKNSSQELQLKIVITGYKQKRWYPSLTCGNSVLVIWGWIRFCQVFSTSCAYLGWREWKLSVPLLQIPSELYQGTFWAATQPLPLQNLLSPKESCSQTQIQHSCNADLSEPLEAPSQYSPTQKFQPRHNRCNFPVFGFCYWI